MLYATGPVTLGTDSGNCKSLINAPPGLCGGSFPTSWYQSGWPARLQLNVAGNGAVSFANHAIFWGVIDAPNSPVTASGGGTPQVDVFGSVVAGSASAAAQFAFHFDQSRSNNSPPANTRSSTGAKNQFPNGRRAAR